MLPRRAPRPLPAKKPINRRFFGVLLAPAWVLAGSTHAAGEAPAPRAPLTEAAAIAHATARPESAALGAAAAAAETAAGAATQPWPNPVLR